MAFDFAGTDVVTRASVTPGDVVTWAAWVNFTTFNGFNAIFMHGGQVTTGAGRNRRGGLLLWFDSGNTNLYWTTGRETSQGDASITVSMSTATWYHVAVVYNYTTFAVKLYLNGQIVLDTTVSGSGAPTADGQTLYIGNTAINDASMTGKIQDLAVWSRALTNAEIIQVYSYGVKEIGTTGLYGYWRMRANPVADATDYSSNNRNGTNSGAASSADGPIPGSKAFVRAIGAPTATSQNQTISPDAPTCEIDDILYAVIYQNDNLSLTTVPADWAEVRAPVNNGTGMRASLYWKRAVAGDSGAGFTFGKSSDNNTLFYGYIFAVGGVKKTGDPHDTGSIPASVNTPAVDACTYPAYDPNATDVHVFFVGYYANDQTAAEPLVMSGTNPSPGQQVNIESSVGADASLFLLDGDNNGEAIASRNHGTSSATDAVSVGITFAVIPHVEPLPTSLPSVGHLRGMVPHLVR